MEGLLYKANRLPVYISQGFFVCFGFRGFFVCFLVSGNLL